MISYYNSLPAKGQPHKSSGTMHIYDFINKVRDGEWKSIIDPIRKEKDKDKRSTLKRSLVSVTVSGVFNERKENLLIEHSGLICIDVDNFTDKSSILNDKYTYCCFDSVSGNGFAVIVKINPKKHKESFRFLQKYYFEEYGIVIDPAPQNPASLRYVSYDPTITINNNSEKSKTLVEKKEKRFSTLPIVSTDEQFNSYVQEIVSKGIDLAPDYESYLNLSFALAQGFGENGRNYFHALSSVNEKYNSPHADRQYSIALKRGKTGITIGSLYYLFKQNGIQFHTDRKSLAIAAIGKKAGKSKEDVKIELLQNNVSESTANQYVDEIYRRDDVNLEALTQDPERLIESLMEWLLQNHPIRRNEITKMIEENSKDVKRERLNTIFLRAKVAFNSKDVNYDLFERIIFSEFIKDFNPITEYIDKNRYRNSNGNLDLLVKTIDTPTKNSEVYIKKWCVSIIAAYKGAPVRSVLTLTGGQNTGKTEWFRRLLPTELQRYYAESKMDAGKDDELLMCQKLIVMDDEMGGKSKEDERRFKELTSKNVFSLRAPYARSNEDFKRLAILCGTSNSNEIMNDRTGNTRILPVEVSSINHAFYNNIDKDELFMELVRLYESGFDWKLSKDELNELATESENFEGLNPERELILKYFMPNDGRAGFLEWLTATDIKIFIENSSHQQIKSMKFFGTELRHIFGKPKRDKDKGRTFAVIRITQNAILPNEDPF